MPIKPTLFALLSLALSTTNTLATPASARDVTPASHQGLQAGACTAKVRMAGAPGGDKTNTLSWCWKEPIAAFQREQALVAAIEANMPSQSGRGGNPKCTVQNPQQTGTQTQWQANCEGPFGKITGSASGTFEATQIQTQQSLTAKMLGMSLKLQQQVEAQRTGAC